MSKFVQFLNNGYVYNQYKKHNDKIYSGELLNKENYPDIEEGSDILKKVSEEELEKMKTQYHPAWSCVNYKDDKDLLFIDLHY